MVGIIHVVGVQGFLLSVLRGTVVVRSFLGFSFFSLRFFFSSMC